MYNEQAEEDEREQMKEWWMDRRVDSWLLITLVRSIVVPVVVVAVESGHDIMRSSS